MKTGKMEDMPFLMILQQMAHLLKYQAAFRLEEFQLKPGQAGILFILNREGLLSQRELAEKIGVKPPSMTVALKKMEAMGYVVRMSDRDDLRIVRIGLTEKGKDCVEKVRELIAQTEQELLKGFSQEEKIVMKRLLMQMHHNLMNFKNMRDMDMHELMKRMQGTMDREL